MDARFRHSRRNFLLALGGANLLFLPAARAAQATGTAGMLWSRLDTQLIPADTILIRTSGFSAVGRGSALYAVDADQGPISSTGEALIARAAAVGRDRAAAARAVAALESHFRRRSADGRWWRLAEEAPSSAMFGCPGDGSYNVANPAAATGTDVTANLQALIDYCLYYSRAPARIGPGVHITSDTLHVGYGHDFVQLEMVGPGGANIELRRTLIACNRRDRPTINFQGVRSSRIRGIALGGYLGKKIRDRRMAYNVPPQVDDTNPAEWDDAAFGIADNRHAPYAGVCIDGFSGNLAAGYPVNRPAWVPYGDHAYGDPAVALASADPRRKLDSSDILIEDCDIAGFTVGMMCNPSNSGAQGDFVRLRNARVSRCKWIASFGNDQSRNVGISDCSFAYYYCVLTNRTHGKQAGQIGGVILNTGMGAGIDLIDLSLQSASAFTFQNCYCEAQWRIGRVVEGGAYDVGFTFKDCNFYFLMNGQMGQACANRGVPGAMLYNPLSPGTTMAAAVKFEGGYLYVDSVASLMANCRIDGTRLLNAVRGGSALANVYERHLHNALAGGWALPNLKGQDYGHRMPFDLVDLDSGNRAGVALTEDGYRFSSRSYGTPVYVRTMRAKDDRMFELIPRGYDSQIIDKADFTYPGGGWSGRELTFEYNGASRAVHGTVYGFGPGGVMLDPVTGSVLVIRSAVEGAGKLTIVAVLQNNYRDRGGAATRITAINLAAGQWYVGHCRYFTLPMPHLGDFTSGRGDITNVADGNGTTALAGNLAVDDHLFLGNLRRPLLAEAGGLIAAFSNGARTITVNGSAAYSSSRERLDRFIRALPPNG